jgi:AcrR family transcriptional regulator
MSKRTRSRRPAQARERLVRAAYELFTKTGIGLVGIDAIIAKSGCAKASLYANFKSKDDLAIAYLDMRDKVWTRGWLLGELRQRASDPKARLMAIFDVYDAWFRKKSFEGCAFVNALLETRDDGRVHDAAAEHLVGLRSIVEELAKEAGLPEAKNLARIWYILMKGAVISACAGDRDAALGAKWMARLVLKNWGGKGTYQRPAA